MYRHLLLCALYIYMYVCMYRHLLLCALRAHVYANDIGGLLVHRNLKLGENGFFFALVSDCQQSFDMTGFNKTKLLSCPQFF